MWQSLIDGIRALLHRRRFESELDEELQDHLARDVAYRMSLGMTAVEARRTALAELGGVERVKDDVRQARHLDRLDGVLADLRFAARRVRRNPRYAALLVVSMALGIGAGTSVFSAVDGVLLKPLPYADPDRLLTLWQAKPALGIERDDVAPANFLDWQARAGEVMQLAAADPNSVNHRTESATEVVEAWSVSDGLMEMAGVKPLLGRTFRPEDFLPNAPPVVLVGHRFWLRRLAGDSGVVGRSLSLDGRPVTVAGVLPATFALPEATSLWRPLVMDARQREDRFGTYLRVFGRLRPGVSLDAARTELAAIARRLEVEQPRANAGVRIVAVPLLEVTVGGQRPLLLTLLAAAGLLVMVTLANVAALHLTQLTRQRHESAMRAALGADRLRLARPLVLEAVLLAALGAALGAAIGWGGVRVLHALGPQELPRLADIRLDWRAAAVSLLLALAAAATLAMLSVSRLRGAGSGAIGARTVTGGRASMRSRRLAVGAQLALALVLLVGTALLVTSFRRVLAADPGYRTENVLSFTTWVYDEYPSAAGLTRFTDEVLERLQSIPGVRVAAMGSALPLADGITGENADVIPEGSAPPEGEEPQAHATVVTPRYFEALGMTLQRGRLLEESDDERAQRVIIVNERFARQFFPGQDPIGRTVRVGLMGRATPRLVVGVVGDTRHARLDAPAEAGLFVPWRQQPLAALTFVMRTDVEPGSLTSAVARTMFALDPRVGVARLATLESLADQKLRERRFLMLLVAAFAIAAVVLASVGVFGVMSQTVLDRQREIGVRMALGASPGTIVAQFLREAMRMTAGGIVIGLAIASIAARGLARFLFETTQLDSPSVMSAVLVVTALAAVSAVLPTLRASRANPARTLGNDG